MESDNYLTKVREQYENYPYPKRDPLVEKSTVFVTTTEHIGNISHYCFSGKRDLREGARCLVAGGGTGDAAIFLAEQLRDTKGEVVYVDLSLASMDIARERAKIKGLTNITWHQQSLLDLPDMDIGHFDYINCCGVLHHLENPSAGLNALKSMLTDDGAMAIMVYAKYGRTAIYQMQELMRLINKGENNLQQCVDNTHLTLAELPESNWYKRDEHKWKNDLDDLGDIEIYDLFLHSQDRAYTVLEVYQWLNDCKLNMVSFTGFSGTKLKYAIHNYLKNENLTKFIEKTSLQQQQAMAELINGNIKTHTFYVSKKSNTLADYLDVSMIPYFTFQFAPPDTLFNDLNKNPTKTIKLKLGNNIEPLELAQSKYTRYILRYLDGNRTLGEIIQQIKSNFTSDSNFNENALLDDYNTLYSKFFSYELMLLRSKDIKRYKTHKQLVAETLKRNRPSENSTKGVTINFSM